MTEHSDLLQKIAELQLQNQMLSLRLKNSQSLANQFAEERAEIARQLWQEGWVLGPNGEVIERKADPLLKAFSGKLLPITLWFRIVPDDDGNDSYDYNHFEEGHVEQSNPTPRAGNKFSGRWSCQFAYRTDAICPQIKIISEREAHGNNR